MEFLRDIMNSKSSKLIGAAIGIAMGIIILIFGFFKALFIVFCAFVGWHIGNAVDRDESIGDIIKKILTPGNR